MFYIVHLTKFTTGNIIKKRYLSKKNAERYPHIFTNKEKALDFLSKYNRLYNEFKDCYLNPEYLLKNHTRLRKLRKDINKRLEMYINYNGMDFCDVSAGGIQIRTKDKRIEGFTLSSQFTLKYDLSNIEEAVEEVLHNYQRDAERTWIESYKSFLAEGKKYGWD